MPGCEAALAAPDGQKTLLTTISLENVAMMPCNPAIGGPGKSHLVKEIDALGGEMGIAADATAIQMRMLNLGKRPGCLCPALPSPTRANTTAI